MPATVFAPDGLADLKKAISDVVRGDESHNATRSQVIAQATTAKASSLIPDNWNSDGSLKDTTSVWDTDEARATYSDLRQALTSAIADSLPPNDNDGYCDCWVQDFTDTWAVYENNGDLIQVDYTTDDDGNITLGTSAPVRQVTTYVKIQREAEATAELEKRRKIATRLEAAHGLERRSISNCGELRTTESVDDGQLHISGYASIFDRPYEVGSFTETIKRGAFTKTLNERAQVVLLLNHGGLPMASTENGTLVLTEDDIGLRIDASLDPDDPDSQTAVRKVKRGDMREMSFAFQAVKQTWNEDYTERKLSEVSINKGDVSIVNFGANDGTRVAARGALEDFEREAVRFAAGLCEEIRNEQRLGKAVSAALTDKLQSVLDLVSVADTAVDQAQIELSDIMGVENPDKQQDADLAKQQKDAADQHAVGASGKDGTADVVASGTSSRGDETEHENREVETGVAVETVIPAPDTTLLMLELARSRQKRSLGGKR